MVVGWITTIRERVRNELAWKLEAASIEGTYKGRHATSEMNFDHGVTMLG